MKHTLAGNGDDALNEMFGVGDDGVERLTELLMKTFTPGNRQGETIRALADADLTDAEFWLGLVTVGMAMGAQDEYNRLMEKAFQTETDPGPQPGGRAN